MVQKDFEYHNPDYPVPSDLISIQPYAVKDEEIPTGGNGINIEKLTYGQLRHQPITDAILQHIEQPQLLQWARECNERNQEEGFEMYKVDEEYCFWGLRVGPTVSLPSAEEMKNILLCSGKENIVYAVINKTVTQKMIRDATFEIYRKCFAFNCGIKLTEAKKIITQLMDCTPHEDQSSGLIFMVPNWAHRWFHHDGYVKHTLRILNRADD